MLSHSTSLKSEVSTKNIMLHVQIIILHANGKKTTVIIIIVVYCLLNDFKLFEAIQHFEWATFKCKW